MGPTADFDQDKSSPPGTGRGGAGPAGVAADAAAAAAEAAAEAAETEQFGGSMDDPDQEGDEAGTNEVVGNVGGLIQKPALTNRTSKKSKKQRNRRRGLAARK